jgi:hypothetical protein
MKKVLVILFSICCCITNNGVENDKSKSTEYIIPNLSPPPIYFEIPEGSCGEACLWTILQASGRTVSQEEINIAGGNPGRGLYWKDLFIVLNRYNIKHRNISKYTTDYHDFLYNEIIERIKIGHPILLGVKIYPDEHPEWSGDHFILVVGYNSENDEIIYNTNTYRKRIEAEKLLNTSPGYSLINRHNYVLTIEFANIRSN